MTLADARAAVLEGLKEVLSSRGLVPDNTALDRWINRANEAVWVDIAQKKPAAVAVRSTPESVPVNAAKPGHYRLGSVTQFQQTGSENGVYSILSLWGQDVAGDYRLILQANTEQDEGKWNPQPAGTFNVLPARWFRAGQDLVFVPPPAQAFNMLMRYVPSLAAMTQTTDPLLGGLFQNHHDLVVTVAMQLLWKKDEERVTPWDSEVTTGQKALYQYLSRMDRGGRRRVRKVSHY